jgi:hypothetical protein
MVRLWWRNGAMIELLHSDLPTRRAPIWGVSGFSKQFHKERSRKPAQTCTAVVRGLPDSGIQEMLNQPYRRGGKEHYIPAVATNYLDHRQYVAVTGHVGSGNDFVRFPLSTTAYRTVKADPPRVHPLF